MLTLCIGGGGGLGGWGVGGLVTVLVIFGDFMSNYIGYFLVKKIFSRGLHDERARRMSKP